MIGLNATVESRWHWYRVAQRAAGGCTYPVSKGHLLCGARPDVPEGVAKGLKGLLGGGG